LVKGVIDINEIPSLASLQIAATLNSTAKIMSPNERFGSSERMGSVRASLVRDSQGAIVNDPIRATASLSAIKEAAQYSPWGPSTAIQEKPETASEKGTESESDVAEYEVDPDLNEKEVSDQAANKAPDLESLPVIPSRRISDLSRKSKSENHSMDLSEDLGSKDPAIEIDRTFDGDNSFSEDHSFTENHSFNEDQHLSQLLPPDSTGANVFRSTDLRYFVNEHNGSNGVGSDIPEPTDNISIRSTRSAENRIPNMESANSISPEKTGKVEGDPETAKLISPVIDAPPESQ
jgi:hypothetical protein